MPASADPADTAIITFVRHNGVSIQFECRFLTRSQKHAHQRCREGLSSRKDDGDWWSGIRELHDIGIVRWMLDKPYSFEALDDELSEQDIIDLCCSYPSGVTLTEIEMGKSPSRRRYLVGNSAATAPAVPAANPEVASKT